MPKRIIRAVSASYKDPDSGEIQFVEQGQVVDLPQSVIDTLEPQRALVPEGWDSFQQFHDASIDAYRGGRGDTEASARAIKLAADGNRGGVVDVNDPAARAEDENPHIATLRTQSPGVAETVALAGDDPAEAAKVLQAEEVVTGGDPRAGVVKGLAKITAA
jgi:hypothetical protein